MGASKAHSVGEAEAAFISIRVWKYGCIDPRGKRRHPSVAKSKLHDRDEQSINDHGRMTIAER